MNPMTSRYLKSGTNGGANASINGMTEVAHMMHASHAAGATPLAQDVPPPWVGGPAVDTVDTAVDRFTEEQMFEEDVRAVLTMMRPHRKERLMGWNEYRTGGAHFRATISWDPAVEQDAGAAHDQALTVPHLTDVLESILVGSVKNQDELHAADEFEIYRGVVRELYRRLDEMQSCYE